jgi:hypothetical protein
MGTWGKRFFGKKVENNFLERKINKLDDIIVFSLSSNEKTPQKSRLISLVGVIYYISAK